MADLKPYRDPKSPEVPEVVVYVACQRCSAETPMGLFPVKHARLSVGITNAGALIIWCERHGCQVAKYANDAIAQRLRELVA